MKFFASKVVVFFSFFVVFNGAVSSQSLRIDTDTAEQLHHAAAARLAAATNFRETAFAQYQSEIAGVMGQLQQSNPGMPGKAFDILDEEFEAIMPKVVNAMLDATIELYKDRFSTLELNEISSFYESSLGQKALIQMRSIASIGIDQGKLIGQRYGKEAANKAIRRIREEGLDLSSRSR